MAVFDDKPSKDSFANMVAELIRQAGDTQKLRYDADQFQLVGEGEHMRLLNLHNVYAEYCSVPLANRQDVLKRFVRSWFSHLKEVPKDFADARHDLLPSVRSRSYYSFARLQLHAQGSTKFNWPHRVLANHLAVGLTYDLPESMVQLQQQSLTDWGVTFEQALDVAIENLRELSKRRFEMPEPGVWASPFRDNYDTARMLLVDWIRDHSVKGEPIAMIPNRDTLLFTGSEDDVGLENMLQLAEYALEQPRPITGISFRLQGNTWEPYLPDADHPLYQPFKLMWVRSLGTEYADQLELLNDLHTKTSQDIFVASFSAIQKEDGEIVTYSVWSQGVDSLLPKTDLVHFFVPQGDEDGAIAATADWDTALRIVGDLMEPAGMYPERYRVKSFPSDEQLGLLRGE